MRHDRLTEEHLAHSTFSAAELLDQAEQRLSSGHPAKAVALAQEAAARAGSVSDSSDSVESRVETLVRASQILSDADEDVAAFLACQRALRLTPAHAHATYNAALALKDLGRFAQAESLLDETLARHPDDLDLLRLKADLMSYRDAHDDVALLLRQVLQHMPEDKVAWFNLSNALLQLRQYAEAQEAAERAIALASPPQVADAWANKGRALTGRGQDTRAIAAFQTAVRINRAQLQAHYGLALLYQRHGQRFLAWRERLFGRLLHMIYRARHHAAAQLHREELRLLDTESDTAEISEPT